MKTEKQKETPSRGGTRPGSGRPKAAYKTTTIAFRVKTHHVLKVKEAVKALILTLNAAEKA